MVLLTGKKIMTQINLPDWNMDDYKLIKDKKSGGTRFRRVELPDRMPAGGFADPITLDIFTVRKGAPTVILHPILGGDNVVAKLFADFFTHKIIGWNAVIQHRARYPFAYGSLEKIEDGMQNIIANSLQACQWLEHHKYIKPKRTISVGTSLGAISNALLTPQLPYAGFAHIMAGGNMPHILTKSEEGGVVKWRKKLLKETGMTRKELRRELEGIIKTDPVSQAAMTPRNVKVRMFLSRFDKSIPYKDQRALLKAYNKTPVHTNIPSGHLSMALFIPYLLPEILRWGKKVIK